MSVSSFDIQLITGIDFIVAIPLTPALSPMGEGE